LQGSLVSAGGHKGWGFGLMAGILAAAMTGSLLSRDVKPLKASESQPHDLGQCYILIDPKTSHAFDQRMASLIETATQDPGARLPGHKKAIMDPVEVAPDVWTRLEELARAS
jgi:(2R)-3-sulfolactate dehydrogenase (NADP+)